MKYIRWIWDFWRPHRSWLYLLVFFTLLSSAVAIGYPLVFMHLIDVLDDVLSKSNPGLITSTTWKLVLMISVVGVARSLANFYPGFRAMLNCRIEMGVREHYFGAIINKGYRFFSKFRTGDLVTRLTDDISSFPKIAWFSCSGVFRAVESGSKFIFCMAVMLYLNWQLALLTLVPLPIMLWIFYRVRTAISRRALERQRIMSTTNDALEAAFSGVRILKAFRGENHQSREFDAILTRRIGVELNLIKLWMGMMNLHMGVQFIGQLIVVVAGGIMYIRGTLTLGEFYAFYVYLSMLLQPLMDIPHLFVTSRQAFACIDREIEIEETPGGTENIFTGSGSLDRIDSIELRAVEFKYEEGQQPAVRGANLKLKRGERVAIVGAVGSGKTTLLKLAAGILPATKGEVLVNGCPLADTQISAYRERIGYIPQESTLFSESVLDNVRFGREIEIETAIDALELARVKAELEALPNGFNQVLGQKGLTISGGQKQRLAIARALAGDPDLLLMDDCTASLDAENERAFWEQFSGRFPQAACLIVTHRLSTARQADVVYVLDAGQVVGRGTHMELLESCEEYRNFLTRKELQDALALNNAGTKARIS